MKQRFRLTIFEVIRETPNAVVIHFRQPASGRIWYYPGQFLTLILEINGERVARSYSLCSSPQLDDTLAIAVKRVPGGKASNYLNAYAQAGMQIEVIQPQGRFYLENSIKNRRHVLLIGGGSGITPLFSILRSTLFNEPHSEVSLIFANRSEREIIFKEQLKELERKFSNRFRVFHFLSQSSDADSIIQRNGRASVESLTELLLRLWEEIQVETLCFLCGPEGLMDHALEAMETISIAEESIYQEHFGNSPVSFAIDDLAGLRTREISLRLGDREVTLTVSAGRTILDAAIDENLPLLYSCRRGTCATCIGKLLEGEVRMAFNEGITDWDVERGYRLLCQSFPLTDDVVIEAGI